MHTQLLDILEHIFKEFTQLPASENLGEIVLENVTTSIHSPHSREVCYRASSIGKPWILQVLNRWYPTPPSFNIGASMKMMDGVFCQAWAEAILTTAKYQFTSEQEHVLAVGGEQDVRVVGHSDIVVRQGREIVVLECKSMASHLISKFCNAPNDEYGYLSQLSFYSSMVQLANPGFDVSSAFLVYDRSNAKYRIVAIHDSTINAKFDRVQNAVGKIAAIPQFDLSTLLSTVVVPPIVAGQVPSTMKWSKWAQAFYRDGELLHPAESKRIIEAMVNPLTQEVF